MQQPHDPTPSKLESQQSSSELRERAQIISKSMALFPVRPGVDPETVLAAYLDETADIPLPYMQELVAVLRGSGLGWLPSLPEMRELLATRIRRERRVSLGQDLHDTVEQKPIDTEGILKWAAEKAPMGFAQLHAIGAANKPRLAIEAQNREAVEADASLTPHQQRSELTRITLEHIEGLIEADGLTPQLKRRQHERERRARR